MDTFVDPTDWRRKSYEVTFECSTSSKHGILLKSVCLACSKQCHKNARLRPYIRMRKKGGTFLCPIS